MIAWLRRRAVLRRLAAAREEREFAIWLMKIRSSA